MKRITYTFCLLFIVALSCLSIKVNARDYSGLLKAKSTAGQNKDLLFIENKGQWVADAKFKAEIPGGALFLTDNGFVYNYVSQNDLGQIHELYEAGKEVVGKPLHFHSYKVNFLGAHSDIRYLPTRKSSVYNNYFIGNDPSKWAGHVGLYGEVVQQSVYNGIDLAVYSNNNNLKYDFRVAAGADPAQIKLAFEGVQPKINKDGDLQITTTVNEVLEKAPYTYQNMNGHKVEVKSKYKLVKGQLSFEFPEGYDPNYPLVIDPNLVFCTYSGGTGGGSGYYSYTTTYDDAGNAYAGSSAYFTGWPTTTGAFQTTYGGGAYPNSNVAINKYSSDGSSLIYSTYYGGSLETVPHAMRVNDLNELVVVGHTMATNLPVTTGCFDSTSNGTDIFVAHFNAAGSALIGATYLGGSGNEPTAFSMYGTSTSLIDQNTTSPVELNFDDNGNIWIVGNTASTNFPVTTNAQQPTLSGGNDGVILKLNPDCSSLLYSSFLGGTSNDGIFSIEFNHAGNIVICGVTSSTNFPTTSGALHTAAPGGTFDGFASIIDPASGNLLQSTYLGTVATDMAVSIQLDCADNVYVMGRTSGSYPVTPGVYSLAGGTVFIDKLSPSLNASYLSTTLGSTSTSFYPDGFLLDICGNAYVTALGAYGTTLPTTPDAFQSTSAPFWFGVLEPNFSDLLYGSYFGMSSDHTHCGVSRLDPNGIVYHSICNSQQYSFTTPGAWSPNYTNQGQDIVTFKFNFDAVTINLDEMSSQGANDTIPHCVRGCKSAFFKFSRNNVDTVPVTIHYLIGGTATNGTDYQLIPDSIVIPANDTDAILEIKPLLVQNMPTGVKDVTISALSPCGCEDGSQNIVRVGQVLIFDSLFVNIPTLPDTVCSHTEITITAEIDSTLNFEWQPAALIPDPYPQGLSIHPKPVGTTTYSITVTQPGAPATCPPNTASYQAVVEQYPQIHMPAEDTIVCINSSDSINLNAYAIPEGVDYNFHWTPATYLRDDFSANNKFSAPVGDYKYVFSATSPWAGCFGIDSMVIHVAPPFSFTSVSPMDTTINYGDEVVLDARGEAIAWLWLPVTYLNEPTLQSPTARPLEDMIYQVVGFDKYGCRDTAEVKINVEYQSNPFVPTAFSPNGDGLNDILEVLHLQYDRLVEFKIYNRTGQVVFETHNPLQGWDGTYNGKPAAMDTYFYQVEVASPGGTIKTYKGDVSLIR